MSETALSLAHTHDLDKTVIADLATTPRFMRMPDLQLSRDALDSDMAQREQGRRQIMARWGYLYGAPLFAGKAVAA
jgi:hypothetical protein